MPPLHTPSRLHSACACPRFKAVFGKHSSVCAAQATPLLARLNSSCAELLTVVEDHPLSLNNRPRAPLFSRLSPKRVFILLSSLPWTNPFLSLPQILLFWFDFSSQGRRATSRLTESTLRGDDHIQYRPASQRTRGRGDSACSAIRYFLFKVFHVLLVP